MVKEKRLIAAETLKAEMERQNTKYLKAKQESKEATGVRIRKLRKSCGMTQKELAERIGVASSMIGQWENGNRNPRLCTLSKIASACGTSVLFLTEELDNAVTELDAGKVLATARANDALTVKEVLSLLREAVTLLESLS